MKLKTIARSWATEFRLNLRYEPWRVIPHFHKPSPWYAAGFTCARCGSASRRVQRKGYRRARQTGLVV